MAVFFTTLILALLPLPDDSPGGKKLPPGVIAEAGTIRITETAFEDYLFGLYREDQVGRDLVKQQVRETAIRQESARRGIRVSNDTVEARSSELDRRLKAASNGKKGLLDYLKEQNVDEKDFFTALKLSIAHEKMARKDFGMKEGEPVPVEKLNLWLKELLSRKKIITHGVGPEAVASVDGEPIPRAEFIRRLISELGRKKAGGILKEMIGIRVIGKKAAELGIALTDDDIRSEIAEREQKLRSKKGFEKISYADFVKASSGRSLEELEKNAKFRAEVLMKKIAGALLKDDDLAAFFEKNRESFELRFGKAARVADIFLKAARFPNRNVTRSFEDAAEELKAIRKRIEKGEATFKNMARIYSENKSAGKGGDLGFLTPETEGYAEIAAASLKAGVGSLLGPFKTPDGCHLVKILEKRGTVTFDAVRDEVAREARQALYRKFIEEAGIRTKF